MTILPFCICTLVDSKDALLFRQLAEAADGVPLFEVFITMNEKGEYKHQVAFFIYHSISISINFCHLILHLFHHGIEFA